MTNSEMEQIAATIAAAVIRNRDTMKYDDAAAVYFDCLDALKAEDKRRIEFRSAEKGR